MGNKLFFGGIPTTSDVRKLAAAFGVPAIGDEIAHDEMAATLGIAKTSNRYTGVVSAWRKLLRRDHNIEMGAVMGYGLRALNPDERISASIKGIRQGARKQIRSVRLSDSTVTDDPLLVKKQGLMRQYGAAMMTEANTMFRQLEPPKPAEQQPRRLPT